MKILILSIGSRGDMEPFLAIAKIMKDNGHQVMCVFPAQFSQLAKDTNVDFTPLSGDFIEMMNSDEGVNIMGRKGTIFTQFRALWNLYKKSLKLQDQLVKEQKEIINSFLPDRVVHNGKCVYCYLWGIQNPGKATLISPAPGLVHPVEDFPSIGFKKNLGKRLNRITYSILNYFIVQSISSGQKQYMKQMGITKSQVKQYLLTCKMGFSVSPSLFTRPTYWPENAQVLGYHERDKQVNWQPSKELEKFLDSHEKILLLTFGSMVNSKPEQNTKLFMDILQKHKIPTLINTFAGGLVPLENYDCSLFYFVEQIPYEWIMPKVYGVIHHGGSGTTHMCLKYACVNMIIPHIVDQFLFNNIISSNKFGPKGLPINKLNYNQLEKLILDLYATKSYKSNVQNISQIMQNENFTDKLISFIIN
ncbi:MAG: glycosyltransferase [Candidatus Absconditabacteria bacterium]